MFYWAGLCCNRVFAFGVRMAPYPYLLVNVFSASRFGGNPLAVFPDAQGLDDAEMLAIARQFNLSETIFAQADSESVAAVRIFTPGGELPFAGHPLLGCAEVLHRQRGLADAFTLRCEAGRIPLSRQRDGSWLLQANAASVRDAGLSRAQAAAMLGLAEHAVAAAPCWVSTGSEQLLVQASSREAVLAARPVPALFARDARLRPGRAVAYLWFLDNGVATVRLFFEQHGAVLEDPGTGSACANLGGLLALGGTRSQYYRLEQGDVIGRPNRLLLQIDAHGTVHVGGAVRHMAEGVFYG